MTEAGFSGEADEDAADPARGLPHPHPAATLVLVREAPGGRQVLMLRRPANSVFAPDAWVFPGGRVDPSDRHFDHARLSHGPSPDAWAAELSLDDAAEAAAYAVAAIREAWEETGILLTVTSAPPRGCDVGRREVLAGNRLLADFLREAEVRIATGRVRYFARWITPPGLPRRFDTRFFVAAVAAEQRCELLGSELAEFRWLRPRDALEAEKRGEFYLLPPTIDTLRRLARDEI